MVEGELVVARELGEDGVGVGRGRCLGIHKREGIVGAIHQICEILASYSMQA